jgi:GTP-binding protein
MVIAANKIDSIYDDGSENPVDRLKREFEAENIKVFPISAVSGQGVKELLYYVYELLGTVDSAPIVFEREFFPDEFLDNPNDPFTVEVAADGAYEVFGPRIDKMLGYTNLDTEKGFAFFQKFLKESGIIDELKAQGIQEGDTVRMDYMEFEFFE